GGVTTHVRRLLDKLNSIGSSFIYKNLNSNSFLYDLLSIWRYKKFHLHTSNVYVQFLFSLAGKITSTRSIITFHGDLNRYQGLKYRIVLATVKITDYPIVLNQKSKTIAERINSNALLISAFIP